MGLSSGHTHALPRRGTQILPKAYDKSERLPLEFWDPIRLASHVLATLSPVNQRAAAVNLILEMKITGSFLVHYTYQIEELLPDGDCELVRAIARTIPKTFWVPFRAPRVTDCCTTLREIVDDLSETSRIEVAVSSPSAIVEEFAVPLWEYEEEEEEEAKAKREEAEDVLLPESVSEEGATPAYCGHGIGEYQEDDDTGRKGSRRPKEGREGERGSSDHHDDRNDDGTNVLCSLWGQMISLATRRVSSRHIVGGTLWNLGSNFFMGSHDEDNTLPPGPRTLMTCGPRPRRTTLSPSARGGSVAHSWMMGCIGLYGV